MGWDWIECSGLTDWREMFELEEYEDFVDSKANYVVKDASDYGRLVYPTLGFVGEAGEFANKVKKLDRDGDGSYSAEQQAALIDELSDCLWYMTRLSHVLGCNLVDIAKANMVKLQSRAERGTLAGSGDHR